MIETNRLILRPWENTDREPFAQLNSCPVILEFFPNTLTSEESNKLADNIITHIQTHGWGLWAAEEKVSKRFMGFIGLQTYEGNTHFSPTVEIGWRLHSDFWGKGYATEGAKAALEHGFTQLNLNEIVAFTAAINTRSQRVMEKIGMIYNPKDDFIHPSVPKNNPLAPHVLYRISASPKT